MNTRVAALPLSRPAAGYLAWFAIVFVAAAIGAAASAGAPAFYAELRRPAWAPPAWIFGPVWSALYALMAVAVCIVWRARGWSGARSALLPFLAQLALNSLWSWIFFRWRSGAGAFADVLLLWLTIVWTIAAFRQVHIAAAALLVPYLAWVTFAAALTFVVWQWNPALL